MKSSPEEALLIELLGDLGKAYDQIKALPKSIPKALGWQIMACAFVFSLLGSGVGALCVYSLLGGEERRVMADIGQAVLENWDEIEGTACAKVITRNVRGTE